METKITNLARQTSMKFFAIIIAMIFMVSGCNEPDDVAAPVQDDLPSLVNALEAFDEEVEFTQFSSEGNESSRWAYKKWKKKPTFFTLTAALKYTGLFTTVVKNKVTVFAPDDDAFAKLGLNFWNIRQKIDKETLSSVLLNHVASGFVFSTDLDCSLQTVADATLRIIEVDGKLVFKDDTEEVANILFTDRRALNSIFHGIDKVLIISTPEGTIADIAVEAATNDEPQFTQLVSALVKAGLVGAVSDPDANLTVFAPTDEAFQNLYDALDGVNGIDDLSVDVLTRVLLHHVVGSRVFSNCLSSGPVPTLNQEITVNLNDLTLTGSSGNTVNLVTSALDIKALNGVIHVINGVLIPANYLEPLP
jgi:uncharacterized surface protein with fasciclin (FAS1) repeats